MDRWLKRLGSKEAQKQDAKMHLRLMNERENANDREQQPKINGKKVTGSQIEENIAQKIYWIVIDRANIP